jgi:hypothetical protein
MIEFGIPMKLVRLIKMHSTETCNKVHQGKYLSDAFPIQNGLKHGDTFSSFLLSFALEYAIRKAQENKGCFDDVVLLGFGTVETHLLARLHGAKTQKKTHQLLVCADGINLLGENTEVLLNARKEVGLEVTGKKTLANTCLC